MLGALRPAWCHTRTAVPPVPSPRSEWPQAGDPAQDLAELPLTLFSSSSPLAEVPVPAGRVRGARGKGRGEWHNQQTQMVPPAHLTVRQTVLWAVFEHRRGQKHGLSMPALDSSTTGCYQGLIRKIKSRLPAVCHIPCNSRRCESVLVQLQHQTQSSQMEGHSGKPLYLIEDPAYLNR